MEHTCILLGKKKKKVTYTLIYMTSYYLLNYQVKSVVGYQNNNKLT